MKYAFQRTLLNDDSSDNDIRFTYIDNYVKVNGYLDFTLFNYDEIEKINQEAMPLSYFKISRDMTYKTLKANLEKEGYKCTTTK